MWYEGRLDDGTIFDSSDLQGKLLEFTVGGKKVIADFGNAAKGKVVVDTNHPLAGKTLHFKIRVEDILQKP